MAGHRGSAQQSLAPDLISKRRPSSPEVKLQVGHSSDRTRGWAEVGAEMEMIRMRKHVAAAHGAHGLDNMVEKVAASFPVIGKS